MMDSTRMDSNVVLVTGGAGYIGSHVVLALRDAGWGVVVLDDLSTGRREAVPATVPFVRGDVGDSALVRDALSRYRPTAVMHFAGSIVVPESVTNPLKYYTNNSCASLRLISACVAAGVQHFVFSSTAAVYGNPQSVPISEEAATAPINPYGTSKLCTEWMLRDTAAATADFRYVALRYFNVAGADPQGRAGQMTAKATHLIKVASEVVVGKRPFIEIFGDDYPTPDGTCIRDYIHVSDLADAHLAVLRYLLAGGSSTVFNCGYGHGHSVAEVMRAVTELSDSKLEVRRGPRRPGDSAQLVADTRKIREQLNWYPRHDDLRFIVKTAVDWERRLSTVS